MLIYLFIHSLCIMSIICDCLKIYCVDCWGESIMASINSLVFDVIRVILRLAEPKGLRCSCLPVDATTCYHLNYIVLPWLHGDHISIWNWELNWPLIPNYLNSKSIHLVTTGNDIQAPRERQIFQTHIVIGQLRGNLSCSRIVFGWSISTRVWYKWSHIFTVKQREQPKIMAYDLT